MADRKAPRPKPPGKVQPPPPTPPPKHCIKVTGTIALQITHAEARVLESALFGKIQLCQRNDCDIRDFCGVDMWDLSCRIGRATMRVQ